MGEESFYIHQQAGVEDVQSSAGVSVLHDYCTAALHHLLHHFDVPWTAYTLARSYSR